jgi:hypothetical protein
MLKKIIVVGLAPLALMAAATSASANPKCPDLSESGLSDEEIMARCSDKPERYFAGLYAWFSNVTFEFFAYRWDDWHTN